MKLFKYVTSERVDILENGFIRFTQPEMLNDPCEFKPTISSLVTESQSEKKFNQFFDEEINELPVEIREQAKNLKECIANEFKEHIQGKHVIKDINKVMHSVFEKKIGVLSLAEANNNTLMWSHYAGGHTGFVIEFNSQNSFFNQRKTEYDEFRHVVKVKYQKNIKYNFYDMKVSDLMAKGEEWSYENEYKMVVALQDSDKTINGDIHLFKLPFNAIKSITLGCKISNELKQKIKNLVNTKERKHIKLFENIQIYNEFYVEQLTI